MVEYQITDTELIIFLESNNENLEIYTDEYFVYFDIHADIHMVKKGAGIIKGGSENDNEDPTRIQLPYKFFYDKMMYINKAMKEKWVFPQTNENSSSSSLSMYDKFQNAILNKRSTNDEDTNEDINTNANTNTNTNILFDKASDMKSSLYNKFEKIMENLKLKENAKKILTITPVELNQKQPLPEPFLKPEEEEDSTQLPDESEESVAVEPVTIEPVAVEPVTIEPVAEEPSPEKEKEVSTQLPDESKEPFAEEPEPEQEEEYNYLPMSEEEENEEEEYESPEGELRIQYPENENSFQLYEDSATLNESSSEEESHSEIPSDTKLKITILLKGQPAVHIEKEKLYKHKPIYSHMKQLLKKGIRWENIEGFFIGDKIFVIGNYTKNCKKKTTPFDQKEFENTELYKLIKESECIFV